MTPKKQSSGQIIAFRNDRLGGRLLMIVNAMRLAQLMDVPFRIHWHRGTDFSAVINEPTDFFDADFVTRNFIDRRAFLTLREGSVRPQERQDLGLAGLRTALEQGTNILIDEGFGFSTYEGEDPAEVARVGAALWREVPLAPTVATVLQQVRATIGPKTTAYHIRRGDILSLPRAMNRQWPNKYVYDELYETHIEASIAAGARPILFSDDAATVKRFKDRYPELIPAATLFDSGSVTPGQADFLELLALSSCSRIIGPPQSAFSSGAAALGEIPIIDVEQALAPEQREAAGNRLLERLREPDPQGKWGPGDVGQSLVHLDRHLARQKRFGEMAAILDRHLRAGLEISFLFPRLVELNLQTNAVEAAIAAGALMEGRQVYHRPDFAKGQILHAFAQLAQGRTADCARLANIALWHEPAEASVAEGVAALYVSGLLDDSNALPFSPAARALWQRPILRLPVCEATSLVKASCAKDTLGRALVPAIDPLTWDWAPLMRSFARGGLAKHRLRPVFERSLARLGSTMPGADAASLTAVYDMHVGEKTDWLGRLVDLATAFPDDAMVQHRLSLAATLALDFKTAAAAAERAVEIAPEIPAHVLWRSTSRMRQKRYRMVMSDVRTGLDAGLVFPGMYLRLAHAAAAAGHPNVERSAIEEGIAIAPRNVPLRLFRAQRAIESGSIEAALADLELLMNHDIVAKNVPELRQVCLDLLAGKNPSDDPADIGEEA